MIQKNTFAEVLLFLGFKKDWDTYKKSFWDNSYALEVDFKNEQLIYPETSGLIINDKTTSNFKAPENFVVFECVHRLLCQWYHPKHIELEPKWQVGHGMSGWKADIIVKDNSWKSYLIIECKTAWKEFQNAWRETQTKTTQIFSYAQQAKSTQFIALYASDFVDSNVVSDYYLISLKDNPELIAKDKDIVTYKNANSVEEIYKVWSETYDREYTKIWLFENNRAYDIWKDKYSIDDLKSVSSKDIQGKYHEFATILRQHNVSGRENAFDKLVNLFLCKVVDEKNNSENLQFYWKGKAYDDPFSLQDRLQKLYSIGMKQFLWEEITYIDNSQIDQAFRVFKDKPNATKDVIKDYFKQLKFFTNNDFAFIDIHNEKLFYQNFAVFLKIIKSFQDIRLTGSEENQFLWDMFEWFLDQWVKQSEGQFFTPMPIVKFLIHSLPKKEQAHVIDYACGSGHFLNEYASQNNCERILGIEKEYRLSKVAKVSAFMYGNEDIEIIYDDGLAKNPSIKENSFDVLIANPPYSVKGFLETLSETERNSYQLTEEIDKKSYSKNNAIECFFIEKATKLLKDDAIAAIILPSSILNKWGGKWVYAKTREIILRNFDIIAISELWSGTFGKTGTNTVTLFLQKKKGKPTFAEHFETMVDSWFVGDFHTNEAHFENTDILKKYCLHQEYNLEDYKLFLSGEISESLKKHENFKEYISKFDAKSLLKWSQEIEKQKLLYFWIASQNKSQVLIIKSPSGTSEIKKFLGYEWGGGKWNEGIKYIASQQHSVQDDELEADDKRVLENIQSLGNIETPLYNPHNLDDQTRINTIIKQNFSGTTPEIPEELQAFVTKAKLTDMLDFTRKDLENSIWLNPKILKPIQSKYPQENFKELFLEIKNWKNLPQSDNWKYRISRIESIAKWEFDISATKWTSDTVSKNDFLEEGDILFSHINSVKHLWKTALFEEKEKVIHGVNLLKFKSNLDKILPKYAIELFKTKDFKTEIENQAQKAVNQASVNISYLQSLYFPLPPLDIQQKIIDECEVIDSEVEKVKGEIELGEKRIEEIVARIEWKNHKLWNLFSITRWASPRPIRNYITNDKEWVNWIKIWDVNPWEKFVTSTKEKITQDWANKSRKVKKWDFILSNSMSFWRPYILWIDGCVHDWWLIISNFPENIYNLFLFYVLWSEVVQSQFRSLATGTTVDNLNISRVEWTFISVPDIGTQKKIVAEIEGIEAEIAEKKKIIESSASEKQKLLQKYL